MTSLQKYLLSILSLCVFAAPLTLFAAYINPIALPGVDNIPSLLLALVDLILLLGVPVLVICIIYSGFLFVTAGGNESQVQKARFVFMWTIIGALVLFGAKGLALAIEATVLALK